MAAIVQAMTTTQQTQPGSTITLGSSSATANPNRTRLP